MVRRDVIDRKKHEVMNMVIWNIVHGFMERAVVVFLPCFIPERARTVRFANLVHTPSTTFEKRGSKSSGAPR